MCGYNINKALSWTPLHGAVVMSRPEMTQLLMSKGATSEGVDSEVRFYNYKGNNWTTGNPCIHNLTPIQLSMTPEWMPNRSEKRTWTEIQNDRKLVKDILLQHSERTEHPEIPNCSRCPWRLVGEIVWGFRNFASHSSTKDCLVKRFNLQ